MKSIIYSLLLTFSFLNLTFCNDEIDGVEEAEWGQQIILTGSVESDICGWILVNPPKDTPVPFTSFDGKKIVFSTKYPGKYYFVFSFLENEDNLKQVKHCLLVKGGDFIPDPEPEPDNNKLPDGKFKLAQFARKSAENPEILPSEQLENVDIVASIYGEVAILAETSPDKYKPGQDLSIAVVERMKERLGMESFEQWKKFGMTIAQHIQEELKLTTLKEEVDAWKEVSIGLRSLVSKRTIKALVPRKIETSFPSLD